MSLISQSGKEGIVSCFELMASDRRVNLDSLHAALRRLTDHLGPALKSSVDHALRDLVALGDPIASSLADITFAMTVKFENGEIGELVAESCFGLTEVPLHTYKLDK